MYTIYIASDLHRQIRKDGKYIMNKALIVLGALAAVGTGVVIAKKLVDKNPEAAAAVKDTCTEQFNKASIFCAGAIKTGTQKLSDVVATIVDGSKEKGAAIVEKAKTGKENIKSELTHIKDMVTSINSGDAEVEVYDTPEMEFTEETELFEVPEEGTEAL